jgi:hypothetical protein
VCYDSLADLANLVKILEEDMLNKRMYLQDVVFPESSCALIEAASTLRIRRLMRFTAIMNQDADRFVFQTQRSQTFSNLELP